MSFAYASIGRRFIALILDGIIISAIGLVAAHLVPIIGGFVIWFFYAPILECSSLQATLGKHLMRIEVTSLHGGRISFREALIRNLMKIVSGFILFMGFFFALFSERKQTLHDLVAETLVLDGSQNVPVADAWVESVKSLFASSSPVMNEPRAGASARDIAGELERLHKMRDQGAITPEEYEIAKRKILST